MVAHLAHRSLSFLPLRVDARLATMINILLYSMLLLAVKSSSANLNLLPTTNTSSVTASKILALNATRLTTHNVCFDHSAEILPTTKSDCERALDKLVNGRSLVEPHTFGYNEVRVTDPLPVEVEYRSCSIALMMFDLDARVKLTYAEIYAELLGPDGVVKDCLGLNVPAADALGGQSALGPGNKLVADVSGLFYKAAD